MKRLYSILGSLLFCINFTSNSQQNTIYDHRKSLLTLSDSRSKEIDDVLREKDGQEMQAAEAATLTILGLNPLVIFGVTGGAILPLDKMLVKYPIARALAKHEALGVYAAEGYSAVSGKPAFVTVTSGPGILYALAGSYDATMDLYPVVIISGNVKLKELENKNLKIFQKADVVNGARAYAKNTIGVKSGDELQDALIQAYQESNTLPHGAVIVDVPVDIFLQKTKFKYFPEIKWPSLDKESSKLDHNLIEQAAQLINNAQRPFVVVGRGCLSARKQLWRFIEKLGLPFGYTLKGKGIMPDDHPQNYGYIGMHGRKTANRAMENADIVLLIGCSGDDRAFPNAQKFTKGKIIVINPDPKDLLERIKPDILLSFTADKVLTELSRLLKDNNGQKKLLSWNKGLKKAFLKERTYDKPEQGRVSPIKAMRALDKVYNPDILLLDVGEHQQHAVKFINLKAQNYNPKSLYAKTPKNIIDTYNKQIVTSGTAGTMATSLGYTLGAYLASPRASLMTIIGDGCLEMHLSGYWLLSAYNVPAACILINNREYGQVEELLSSRACKDYFIRTGVKKQGAQGVKVIPQFKALALMYNTDYYFINSENRLLPVLKSIKKPTKPYLVEILSASPGAFPFIPSGKTTKDMIEKPQESISKESCLIEP